MWMLVLVFVTTVPGFDKVIALETLATEDECIALRTTVIEGMAQAYPDDHTYSIECRYKAEALIR